MGCCLRMPVSHERDALSRLKTGDAFHGTVFRPGSADSRARTSVGVASGRVRLSDFAGSLEDSFLRPRALP